MIAILLLLFQSPFQQALDSAAPGAVIYADDYAPAGVKKDVHLSKPVTIVGGILWRVTADLDVGISIDGATIIEHVSAYLRGAIHLQSCEVWGTVKGRLVVLRNCRLQAPPGEAAVSGHQQEIRDSIVRGGRSLDCTKPGGYAVRCIARVDSWNSRLVGGSAGPACVRQDPVEGLWVVH